MFLILSIVIAASQCFACWGGPPRKESKSTGLEEERSLTALQIRMKVRIHNSGKYELKGGRRTLHNQCFMGHTARKLLNYYTSEDEIVGVLRPIIMLDKLQ